MIFRTYIIKFTFLFQISFLNASTYCTWFNLKPYFESYKTQLARLSQTDSQLETPVLSKVYSK